MSTSEVDQFIHAWELEAKNTSKLLRSLPVSKYDFRPDAAGRSLGELAWHLAEIDAYMSHGVTAGKLEMGARPPNVERPRTIEALAPGFERVHSEALDRVRALKPADLDRTIPFFDGSSMEIRSILWGVLLHHHIHHRGQLVLMARLAGGVPPGMYGPTREDMAGFKAKG